VTGPLRFSDDGAELRPSALDAPDLQALRRLADDALEGRPGARLAGSPQMQAACDPAGPIGRIAAELLGPAARAVRAVVFDKTQRRNWAVAWHQDRTIVVRQRQETPGFGPWSNKDGLQHVEPPFHVIAEMATLRIHLDDCGPENAPLLVARGSHTLPRVPAGLASQVAAALETAVCIARAGDIWCYATSILHASDRASAPSRRRVIQADFSAAALPGRLEWLGV
jgi:hypothetical protein